VDDTMGNWIVQEKEGTALYLGGTRKWDIYTDGEGGLGGGGWGFWWVGGHPRKK